MCLVILIKHSTWLCAKYLRQTYSSRYPGSDVDWMPCMFFSFCFIFFQNNSISLVCTPVTGSRNHIEWFTVECSYAGWTPILSIPRYAAHRSLWIIDPGAIISSIIGSKVAALRFGTKRRNPLPVFGQYPPKTLKQRMTNEIWLVKEKLNFVICR